MLSACVLAVSCSEQKPGGQPVDGVRMGATQRVEAPHSVDAMRRAVLDHLALRPGKVVAEIGFGRGWFVFRAAQAVGRSGTVYATDVDPEAVAAMRRELQHIDPAAGYVDMRLCRDRRDTGLDDVADGTIDAILMIDSLCFDSRVPREQDLAYLRRFRRLLRPGGELIHHMDCDCAATPESVTALMVEAGFSTQLETVPVDIEPASQSTPECATEAGRKRERYVGVFRNR
jgi:tRNA A58 N-methylase Trm61